MQYSHYKKSTWSIVVAAGRSGRSVQYASRSSPYRMLWTGRDSSEEEQPHTSGANAPQKGTSADGKGRSFSVRINSPQPWPLRLSWHWIYIKWLHLIHEVFGFVLGTSPRCHTKYPPPLPEPASLILLPLPKTVETVTKEKKFQGNQSTFIHFEGSFVSWDIQRIQAVKAACKSLADAGAAKAAAALRSQAGVDDGCTW